MADNPKSSRLSPKALLRQARELEKAGRRRDASSRYARLGIFLRKKGRYQDAKNVMDHAITLSPDSPRLYVQKALIELALGRSTGARAAMELFTRRALRSKKSDQYREYLEDQLKDIPSLRVVYYDGWLQLDRTEARPFLLLATAYRQVGRLDKAQKACLDALKTKTREKESVALLAEILEDRGQAEPLGHLRRFEGGEMSLADLLLLLSESRPAPSVAAAGTAENKPSAPEEKPLQDLIRELEEEMGIDVEQGRDNVEPLVREFRRKAQDVLAGDAKAHIDMALAFYEMGLMEDARDELLAVKPTDPRFLEGQCLLGDILLTEGSEIGALDVFQQILRDERAQGELAFEARYRLIQIYFRLGDYRQALLAAIELERKAPNYRDLRRLKAEIQDAAGQLKAPTSEAERGPTASRSLPRKTRKLG